MKMINRIKLLTIAGILGITSGIYAQTVPSYVPTNGLVAWWPFNGNAQDESGNGNHGAVNGATLTSDRFGMTNKSFRFDGLDDHIQTPIGSTNNYSISIWINPDTISRMHIIGNDDEAFSGKALVMNLSGGIEIFNCHPVDCYGVPGIDSLHNLVNPNVWTSLVASVNNGIAGFYVNGILVGGGAGVESFGINWQIGAKGSTITAIPFKGKLDDVAIWNRPLTQNEIIGLHNQGICQTNITVTDTLLIHTGINSYNPVTYNNTLKAWPNPGTQNITIDAGNLAIMEGWKIRVTNTQGVQIYPSGSQMGLINQQQQTLDMSSWGGDGLYFLYLIDPQNNIQEVKKIVLAP